MRTSPRLFFSFLITTILLFAAGDGVRYSGTWTSKINGSGGKLNLVLASPEAAADSTFSFSLNGETVPCKTKSMKWNGDRFEGRYTFELQGTALESSLTGKRDAGKLNGSYQTRTEDGSAVDEGEFEASEGK